MIRILALTLASSLFFSCAKEHNDSTQKLVASDDLILELNSGLYSETASVDAAKGRITIDKTGLLTYRIAADLTLADMTMPATFSFERSLKMNPKFVMYSTFQKMEMNSPVSYTERGLDLATLRKTAESDNTVTVAFTHQQTGLSGTAVLSSGIAGIINVESLEIYGKGMIAANDPSGEVFTYTEGVPYWPYYIEKTVIKKLYGMLEGKVSIRKVK